MVELIPALKKRFRLVSKMSTRKFGPRRAANASRLTFSDSSHRSPPLWKMPRGLKTVVVFGSGDQKFSYPPKKRPPKILGFVWIKEFKSQKIHEDERGFTVSQTRGNRNHHMCCAEKKTRAATVGSKPQTANSQFTTSTWFSVAFPICGVCVILK